MEETSEARSAMEGSDILDVAINNALLQNATLWKSLSEMLWDDRWWLPDNITWEDIQPTKDFHYPEFSHPFTYPLIFSLIFIIIKYKFIYPYVFGPIAKSLGLWCKKLPPPPNLILENVFEKCNSNQDGNVIQSSATKLGWSERQVERWLRQRKSADTITTYDKFMLCGYECLSHIFFCIFGSYVMFDKPYLWDISLCWINYPHHAIDPGVWWYYMLVAGWYWSSLIEVLYSTGPRRKDKKQVFVHHICTILLMTLSWICNFVRIGTLVILVHEVADIFILAGKMCIYAKRNTLKDFFFGLFVISWTLTRAGLYPFWIMGSVFTDAVYRMWMPAAIVFESLLVLLLILNVAWTYILYRMVILKLLGREVKDTRSESEGSDNNNKVE